MFGLTKWASHHNQQLELEYPASEYPYVVTIGIDSFKCKGYEIKDGVTVLYGFQGHDVFVVPKGWAVTINERDNYNPNFLQKAVGQ